MAEYRLSNVAKDDLIRIHHYGVENFGIKQADLYFEAFFVQFELIAKRPLAFESVDYIKPGCRKCPCGVDTIYYRINNNFVEIMTIVRYQDLKNIK